MKRSTIGVFTIILACSFIACKNNQQTETEKGNAPASQLEKASWLIGEWGNERNETKVSEIWKKESNSAFIGRSYNLRNNDTVSSEWIRLEQQGDSLFYIPNVKNQNQGEVVKFVMTTATDHQLVFENPTHDFPQKITYELVNNDSLSAEISGFFKGKFELEKFPMHRIH